MCCCFCLDFNYCYESFHLTLNLCDMLMSIINFNVMNGPKIAVIFLVVYNLPSFSEFNLLDSSWKYVDLPCTVIKVDLPNETSVVSRLLGACNCKCSVDPAEIDTPKTDDSVLTTIE